MKILMSGFFILISSFAFANTLKIPNFENALVDASGVDCMANPFQPMSVDLGSPILNWQPLSTESRLRVLFVSIKMSSPGLEEINLRKNFSGKELSCLITGDATQERVSFNSQQTDWTFKNKILIGNLLPEGDDNFLPFDGPGEIELYGLVETPGKPDQPLSLIAPFHFTWPGVRP